MLLIQLRQSDRSAGQCASPPVVVARVECDACVAGMEIQASGEDIPKTCRRAAARILRLWNTRSPRQQRTTIRGRKKTIQWNRSWGPVFETLWRIQYRRHLEDTRKLNAEVAANRCIRWDQFPHYIKPPIIHPNLP